MNAISPARLTPIRAAVPASAAPAANAPATPERPKAPQVKAPAQGPVQDAGKWSGGVIGGLAGAAGGVTLLMLMAIVGTGAFGPIVFGAIPAVAALGGYLGYHGGNTLGGWLEGKKPQAPTAANFAGGTAGAVLGSAGGLWLGVFTASRFAGGASALVIAPAVLLVTALGAIGGGSAAQALVDKVRGK